MNHDQILDFKTRIHILTVIKGQIVTTENITQIFHDQDTSVTIYEALIEKLKRISKFIQKEITDIENILEIENEYKTTESESSQ